MDLSFVTKKPSKMTKYIVVSSIEPSDIVIKNFIDIWQGGTTLQSIKETDVVLDITRLESKFKIGFLNRAVQGLYRFNRYKKDKTNMRVTIYDPNVSERKAKQMLAALYIANDVRDIANEPSNMSNPGTFCDATKNFLKDVANVKISILDDKQLLEENMGLITAVGKGSANPPKLLVIDYHPPKYSKSVCIVGKGVTMDTGGYSIKLRNNMYGMHLDDTGASIVVGLIKYCSMKKMKTRLIGLCPLVENVVSSRASKPGDIVIAHNGKSVEIVDTDAEGRLILADTLSYACEKFSPDYILDFATLTSWSSNLHCHTSYAFFTIDDNIANKIITIGEKLAERSMRIPPWVEYQILTQSDVADVKNYGVKQCPNSDGFMAVMFLLNFIPEKYHRRWLHFDIKHVSLHPSVGLAEGFLTGTELLRLL